MEKNVFGAGYIRQAEDEYRQEIQQQQQKLRLQELELVQQQLAMQQIQRHNATSMADVLTSPNMRVSYPSYKEAREDFLKRVQPSDDFRSEALAIFQQAWKKSEPQAAG